MKRLLLPTLLSAATLAGASVEVDRAKAADETGVPVPLQSARLQNVAEGKITAERVIGVVRHGDPMIVFSKLPDGGDEAPVVEFTLQRDGPAPGGLTVYYATDRTPGFAGDRQIEISGEAASDSGKAHTYRIYLSDTPGFRGRLTGLRIDPTAGPEAFGTRFALTRLSLMTMDAKHLRGLVYAPPPLPDFATPVPPPTRMVEEATEANALVATHLRCEFLENPLGIDVVQPRLSWQALGGGTNRFVSAWQVMVSTSPIFKGAVWDSGKQSGNPPWAVYQGRPLKSLEQVWWMVRLWDEYGNAGEWSEPATWTAMLQEKDREAQWISFQDASPVHAKRGQDFTPPTRRYRHHLKLDRKVTRATVTLSALGLADVWVNGERVHDIYFLPGWSDYKQRAYVRTLDVTEQVHKGLNTVGAEVADGWYAGYVGFGQLVGYGPHRTGRGFYGKTPALWMQLNVEMDDGTQRVVGTEPSWWSAEGPCRKADFLKGEVYDARREDPAWCTPGGDKEGWSPVIAATAQGAIPAPFQDTAGKRQVNLGFEEPPAMQAYMAPPVRVVQRIPAVRKHLVARDTWIFDLGQNIAGVVELKAKGPAGTRIDLRHGEMLHLDGRLMTENLRKANSEDAYVLRGDPESEVWSPRFTYHGFQFVEVKGYPGEPPLDAVTGLVLQSDTPMRSSFRCSDPMINKLAENIEWTQRGNFIEVPTDCPQRDERLGWTGDAQAYVRAATYNADVAAFFTKWMDDLEEAQRDNGAFPAYAPFPMQHGIAKSAYGSAWMDAGVIVPWTLWTVYNDTRLVEKHWGAMTRFMDFRAEYDPEGAGKKVGNPWGDWLNLNAPTDIEYIDCVFGYLVTDMMREMAAALGKEADVQRYLTRAETIRSAFRRTWMNGDRLTIETQTAYALALMVGLGEKQVFGDRLAELVEKAGGKMTTGFLGTRPLLPALTATGHHDLAIRLLQARYYPSWGYEVVNGATSIWERWNSFVAGEGFGNPKMNSFSHYAFGAVSEWMFRDLAGIDTAAPGFREMVISPRPPSKAERGRDGVLTWVRAEFAGPHGPVVSAWQVTEGGVRYDVQLPPGTSASVVLPDGATSKVGSGHHAFYTE